MLKILLLIAIIVVAVLLVRNALKTAADKRDGAAAPPGDATADAKLVRCIACGAFVPKADAVAAGNGFRCGGAGCAAKPQP
jgi:hypothetical protein